MTNVSEGLCTAVRDAQGQVTGFEANFLQWNQATGAFDAFPKFNVSFSGYHGDGTYWNGSVFFDYRVSDTDYESWGPPSQEFFNTEFDPKVVLSQNGTVGHLEMTGGSGNVAYIADFSCDPTDDLLGSTVALPTLQPGQGRVDGTTFDSVYCTVDAQHLLFTNQGALRCNEKSLEGDFVFTDWSLGLKEHDPTNWSLKAWRFDTELHPDVSMVTLVGTSPVHVQGPNFEVICAP